MNEQDKRLDNMISDLPKTLAPESDLWGAIERQLDAPETETKNINHWCTLAIASVIALCLILGQQVLYPNHVTPDANQVADLQRLAHKVNW